MEPNEIPQGEGTGDSSSEQGQAVEDSLINDFLKDIPELERPIVEKYAKTWDGNVTRKFQEIHDSYKDYKEFGDVSQIRQWQQVAQMIERDPKYVYEVLAQELGLNSQTPPAGNQQVPPASPVGNGQTPQEFEGLPQEFIAKFQEQQQLLEQLAKTVIGNHQQTLQQQQEAQLDEYLNGLREKHGDFDEEWVLLRMYKGEDGEAAVKAFKEKFATPKEAAPKPNVPPPLSGGGIIPNQKDVKDLSRQETKDLVTNMILQSQKG